MAKSNDANPYETDNLLQMYLSLNYPLVSQDSQTPISTMTPHEDAPTQALCFPQRMAQLLLSLMPENKRMNNRALDIGCAVGGSAFELSTSFQHVEAFDYRCCFVFVYHLY
eukprot:scaffold43448_cov51-Cyclotella_meneghiniana.AAC.13